MVEVRGERVRVDGQTLIITMTAASMVTRARGAGVAGNTLEIVMFDVKTEIWKAV